MMRGAGGVLAVAVAGLLVCCSADLHQESEMSGIEHNSGGRYDAAGHKPRNLDPLGGGNLVREVRESKHYGFVPYLMSRRFDYESPYGGGGKRDLWPLAPLQYGGYYGDGLPKRNFDEIDRSGLDNFVKKRNFDEIDQTSMPFPYATKRLYHLYGRTSDPQISGLDNFLQKRNFDEIDQTSMPFPYATKRFYHLYGRNNLDSESPVSNFDKKRYQAEYPLDEIDLSHFPIGSKRSQDSNRPQR